MLALSDGIARTLVLTLTPHSAALCFSSASTKHPKSHSRWIFLVSLLMVMLAVLVGYAAQETWNQDHQVSAVRK